LCALSGCGSSSSLSSNRTSPGEALAPFPVVSEGRVYVNTGIIHVLDQKTGATLANYSLDNNGIFSPVDPTIVDGTIYVDGETTTYATYALRQKDGSLLWGYPLVTLLGSFPEANGIVYVHSSDFRLLALRASNGTVIWNHANMDVEDITVSQGILYIATQKFLIIALNAATGKFLWQHQFGQDDADGAIAANGVIYTGGKAGLYALNAGSGNVLWHDAQIDVYGTLVIGNGVIYALVTGDSRLYALRAADGSVLWSYTLPNINRFGGSPIAVEGNVVLYTGLSGSLSGSSTDTSASLAALRASDGSILWQKVIDGSADPSINTDNGSVYTVERTFSQNGGLITAVYAFQIGSGRQLWHTNIPGD
jgi:outer membrane protein assembly factor BamB